MGPNIIIILLLPTTTTTTTTTTTLTLPAPFLPPCTPFLLTSISLSPTLGLQYAICSSSPTTPPQPPAASTSCCGSAGGLGGRRFPSCPAPGAPTTNAFK